LPATLIFWELFVDSGFASARFCQKQMADALAIPNYGSMPFPPISLQIAVYLVLQRFASLFSWTLLTANSFKECQEHRSLVDIHSLTQLLCKS
jgi:hypothetical protein